MYGHLIRRGMEVAADHFSSDDSRDWQGLHHRYQMPAWGTVIIAFTTLGFVLATLALEYTIRLLMVNLAIVETPASTVVKVYGAVDCDVKKDEVDIEVEVEERVVSEKPITYSIKRTMRHITNVSGVSGRFRGLPIFLLYAFMVSIVHMIVTPMSYYTVFGTIFVPFFADIFVGLLAARIHCVWTHTTITTGYKRYYDRVINKTQWKQLLPITVLRVVSQHVFALSFRLVLGLVGPLMDRQESYGVRGAIALIPITTGLLVWLFVVVPVNIMLVRKEASMLDESEETTVRFDRTFGNRIIPGLNVLKVRDAWASITRDTVYRVVSLHVKWVGIVAVIGLAYFHVVLLEMWAIMGDTLPSLISSSFAQLQGM